jgi:anti-sigma-K factor RskA
MTFEQFQNHARLYVVGALDVSETKEFEQARKQFGQKAEDVIRECHELLHAFALSLRPARSSADLKTRLISMVRQKSG